MAFRLKTSEPVADGLVRVVGEEIDKAAVDLTQADQEEAVHGLRTRCKKIRSVLRLNRAALGSAYREENRRYRDIARTVSWVRDYQVMVKSFDRLLKDCDGRIDRRRFSPVRRQLEQLRQATLNEALDEKLAGMRLQLTAANADMNAWSFEGKGFSAVEPGLSKTYAQARCAYRRAYRKPKSTRFHEWRKQAKYHRYHCSLIRRVWPDAMKTRVSELYKLTDTLGLEHDLSMLTDWLHHPEAPSLKHGSQQILLGLIETRQKVLRDQAEPIGRRLFAEGTKSFSQRIGAYWKSAQDIGRQEASDSSV
ncbi:MAG: CHAD domain-containing protein [Salinisphaera sp.]|jgi:CHAD domain-containing protein|nr:CHAD domain-containing protein [Salinisphaera sp.]